MNRNEQEPSYEDLVDMIEKLVNQVETHQAQLNLVNRRRQSTPRSWTQVRSMAQLPPAQLLTGYEVNLILANQRQALLDRGKLAAIEEKAGREFDQLLRDFDRIVAHSTGKSLVERLFTLALLAAGDEDLSKLKGEMSKRLDTLESAAKKFNQITDGLYEPFAVKPEMIARCKVRREALQELINILPPDRNDLENWDFRKVTPVAQKMKAVVAEDTNSDYTVKIGLSQIDPRGRSETMGPIPKFIGKRAYELTDRFGRRWKDITKEMRKEWENSADDLTKMALTEIKTLRPILPVAADFVRQKCEEYEQHYA